MSQSTQDKINTALRNYGEGVLASEISKEDRDNVHDFVISRLAASQDITVRDAIKLVHIIERGSWSDGWGKGYDSAKSFYGER
jgi:hypothetical protein